ncbi:MULTISPECIES: hypothetical protein [Levilactobacillus]|uniref:Uncharacterized protein n=2 Tax=Levilactobacillus TaxID=2767886 RepID=A0A1Y6JY17_9LACO|nr:MULTISPECIES: hypothetical protein [Levilactobacillus]KRK93813.1 hypothetical protein FD25_GL001140 [Levilactobacillus acidifarinae DSM 19394]QFR60281.1 hypothetical protein LZ395_01440 [Levilactobacillus zymae]SMS14700.1 hypothetical protein LZ3411_1650 [Levilactobacillus zymae]GEO68696.1 hypothetical protein LAC03_06060 [Levilactobacillus acidifarinae]GEO71272.1 hypothetical protein LZY01_04400 [Levilactobacillus zymae]
MILGLLLLLLLFPILRLVFGLAGWLLGLVGTLVIGAIVLVAFAALFKFFIVAVLVVGGLWASKAIFS